MSYVNLFQIYINLKKHSLDCGSQTFLFKNITLSWISFCQRPWDIKKVKESFCITFCSFVFIDCEIPIHSSQLIHLFLMMLPWQPWLWRNSNILKFFPRKYEQRNNSNHCYWYLTSFWDMERGGGWCNTTDLLKD